MAAVGVKGVGEGLQIPHPGRPGPAEGTEPGRRSLPEGRWAASTGEAGWEGLGGHVGKGVGGFCRSLSFSHKSVLSFLSPPPSLDVLRRLVEVCSLSAQILYSPQTTPAYAWGALVSRVLMEAQGAGQVI